MGAMFALAEPYTIAPGKPLELRYGLYVHRGMPAPDQIDRVWSRFAKEPLLPAAGPPKTERDCMHGDFRRFTVPRVFSSQKECTEFLKSEK
jgi:hypothetical protein